MPERVRVDWNVPSDVWETFVEYVYDEHGETEGYVGREVERAMREYIDADEFAAVEDKITRLVVAAGRTPEQDGEKTASMGVSFSNDSKRVLCRVEQDLKDDFRSYVKHHDDVRLGMALARALRDRSQGGRAQRLETRLDRVLDDAESLLAELNDDTDEQLGKVERNVIAICTTLDSAFDRDQLEETIRDVADVHSPPSIKNYTELVLERRDVVPSPRNEDVFIPRELADQYKRTDDPRILNDVDPSDWVPEAVETLTAQAGPFTRAELQTVIVEVTGAAPTDVSRTHHEMVADAAGLHFSTAHAQFYRPETNAVDATSESAGSTDSDDSPTATASVPSPGELDNAVRHAIATSDGYTLDNPADIAAFLGIDDPAPTDPDGDGDTAASTADTSLDTEASQDSPGATDGPHA